jgi:hypothetical protein
MFRHSRQSPARGGIPFVINMADSKSYGVRQARKIATGTTRVAVTIAIWRICSMLTMTGIGSLPEENEAK